MNILYINAGISAFHLKPVKLVKQGLFWSNLKLEFVINEYRGVESKWLKVYLSSYRNHYNVCRTFVNKWCIKMMGKMIGILRMYSHADVLSEQHLNQQHEGCTIKMHEISLTLVQIQQMPLLVADDPIMAEFAYKRKRIIHMNHELGTPPPYKRCS